MLPTFVAAVLALAAPLPAQPPAATPPAALSGATGVSGPTGAPAAAGTPVRLEDLPVTVRLGARAEIVRRSWPEIRTVVLVPDEASYIEAVARWTLKGRFPVLIDDGTQAAAEDAARFVRAVQPASVVRWSSGAAPIPDAQTRQAEIERAVFRVWSSEGRPAGAPAIPDQEQLLEHWKHLGLAPPGLVVAEAADHAWPAALALAAGRAQPILWTHFSGGVNASMPLDQFLTFADAVEAAAEKTSLQWRALGDALDAITICGNGPIKVQMDPKTVVALTDLLGRHPATPEESKPESRTPRDHGKRWAWCGQVFGTPEQAAYRAMCSLFVSPKRAWVFDGYPDTTPWSQYDGTLAARTLRQAGLEVTVDDTPRNSERSWRLRADPGVDAGLILVNSKGNADEFNLEPGQCRPSDVPFLNAPAIVYFVHSWSAAVPGERATVAGRWLERGAYAYLGSTQEPFLQAFLPTPAIATRLTLSLPWGAAVRFDETPPPNEPDKKVAVPAAWKLATLGDPLITLGPPPPASKEPLPLNDARDLTDVLRDDLAAKNYEAALRTLTLLGRDKDAARLAAALLRDDPRAVTAKVAAAAILPCMRAHDKDTLISAYAQLPSDAASDGVLRDALWHVCSPEIGSTGNERMVGLLRANLRPDQVGRDASELARAYAHFYGRDAAVNMLSEARAQARTDYDKSHIETAIKRLTARQ